MRRHSHRLLPLLALLHLLCLLGWHAVLGRAVADGVRLAPLLLVLGLVRANRLALLRVGILGAVLPCVLPCCCVLRRIGVGNIALLTTLPARLGSRRSSGGGVLGEMHVRGLRASCLRRLVLELHGRCKQGATEKLRPTGGTKPGPAQTVQAEDN